jgi:hypothetical protein
MTIPDFDDIVFEGLNKDYGAYILRKKYNRVVILSIILAGLSGCAIVLIPYFLVRARKSEAVYTYTYVTIDKMGAPGGQLAVPEIPAGPATLPGALFAPPRRRVPGHEPGPVRAGQAGQW